ncbi:hypothetical protein C7999DRAFT_34209 [Corynascus novoguineensis]|uniref:Uncharacterized protein n=1 Tax=Corynascus novoguineensis TaxID=1126955 RepID=A0AAN7HHA2_9PEZI|nr:hypothetical protein C7999DRAFT_34209 [Corynascus novoguineensis]
MPQVSITSNAEIPGGLLSLGELFLQPLASSLHFNITVSHKARDGSLPRPPDLLRPSCGGGSRACELRSSGSGGGLDCTNLAWLNSNNIGAEIETPEGRRGHDMFQHIDRIFRASGKIEAIRQLLAAARRDDSLPMGAPLRTTPKKKHACIFTARPGTAVALASWADKHLSGKWKVVVVLSKTSASRRQQVIDNAFQDIPYGD